MTVFLFNFVPNRIRFELKETVHLKETRKFYFYFFWPKKNCKYILQTRSSSYIYKIYSNSFFRVIQHLFHRWSRANWIERCEVIQLNNFSRDQRRNGQSWGSYTEKLLFHFLSNWMGYGRGDSFSLDFEPNRFPFGSKLKEKLSPRSYPIQFERKWNTSFLSVELEIVHTRKYCRNCVIQSKFVL